jgi:hypothetical protein
MVDGRVVGRIEDRAARICIDNPYSIDPATMRRS